MNADGLVLAGGRSRRFGSDKRKAMLGGRSLLAICCQRVGGAVGAGVYVAAPRRAELPALPATVAFVADECPGAGPLAGITAALDRSRRAGVVVLACDLPMVRSSTLVRIAALGIANRRVVAVRGRAGWEPLLAFYPRTALQQLRSGLREGPRALHSWLDKLGALALVDIAAEELTNMNRASDLDRVSKRAKGF